MDVQQNVQCGLLCALCACSVSARLSGGTWGGITQGLGDGPYLTWSYSTVTIVMTGLAKLGLMSTESALLCPFVSYVSDMCLQKDANTQRDKISHRWPCLEVGQQIRSRPNYLNNCSYLFYLQEPDFCRLRDFISRATHKSKFSLIQWQTSTTTGWMAQNFVHLICRWALCLSESRADQNRLEKPIKGRSLSWFSSSRVPL